MMANQKIRKLRLILIYIYSLFILLIYIYGLFINLKMYQWLLKRILIMQICGEYIKFSKS